MSKPIFSGHCLIDGQLLPLEQARVSATDRGLLYGDGVFETVRLRQGRLEFWHRHCQRLADSCAAALLPGPDNATLLALVRGALAQLQVVDGVIRVVVSAGEAPSFGLGASGAPRLRIYFLPPPIENLRYHDPGLEVRTLRLSAGEGLALTGVKSLSYGAAARHMRWARLQGADDVLLLGPLGEVIESTSASVLVATALGYLMPALGLAGITRTVVLERAAREGQTVNVRAFDVDEVAKARGVFLLSGIRGIVPIARLDGVAIAGGSVPQARQLSAWLAEAALGEGDP